MKVWHKQKARKAGKGHILFTALYRFHFAVKNDVWMPVYLAATWQVEEDGWMDFQMCHLLLANLKKVTGVFWFHGFQLFKIWPLLKSPVSLHKAISPCSQHTDFKNWLLTCQNNQQYWFHFWVFLMFWYISVSVLCSGVWALLTVYRSCKFVLFKCQKMCEIYSFSQLSTWSLGTSY